MQRDLFTRCVRKVRFYLAPYWRGTREALRKHVRRILLPFRENKDLLADLIRTPAKILAVAGLAWAVNGEMAAPTPEPATSDVARVVAGDPIQQNQQRAGTYTGKPQFAPATQHLEKPDLGTAGGSKRLAFIDESVPASVREQFSPEVKVLAVNRDRSGVEQISEALANRTELSSVDIIAGGGDGYMLLGTDTITDENKAYFASAFRGWQNAMSVNAEIRLQGIDQAPSSDLQATGPEWGSTIATEAHIEPLQDGITFDTMVGGTSHDELMAMATGAIHVDQLGVATRGVAPRATYSPTTVNELITAINNANASAEDDVIDLGGNTFTLTVVNNNEGWGDNGLPAIERADNYGALTIQNGIIERDGAAPNFRLLWTAPSSDLTLDGVTLQNGNIGHNGAAIYCEGKLSVQNSTISGNTATSDGGGIFNLLGNVSISDNSVLTNNTANRFGGGIASEEGDISVTNSTISSNSSNRGGGIFAERGSVTIDGSTLSKNTSEDGGGLYVRPNGGGMTLTVSSSTLYGNEASSDDGGGISAESGSVLNLTDSKIASNKANSDGGGIYCRGNTTVDIKGCTIEGNSARSDGGGIACSGNVDLDVASTTLSYNKATYGDGGAIYGRSSNISVTDSTLSKNSAVSGGSDGGAVAAYYDATLSFVGSTVSQNTADDRGGAINIRTRTTLSIVDSTVSENEATTDRGGGICSIGDTSINITRSTLSENKSGHEGGAIYCEGNNLGLNITNSTLSGNTAALWGGGLAVRHDVTFDLYNSTVASNTSGNSGGGVFMGMASGNVPALDLVSTIVANNSAGGNPGADIQLNDGASISSYSHCLILDGTGGHGITTGANFCRVGENPLLGPLQDNGGPTFTHALLANSPAINTGTNPLNLTTDQRGAARVINAIPDMGAFEYGNSQASATNLDQAHNYPVNAASVLLDDIVVTDPDFDEQITATLRLNNPNTGALSATSGNGETFNASSGVWTITASVADVNAALAAVAFIPATDNQIATTVSVQVEDGGEAGTQPLLGEIFLNAAPLIINAGASPNPVAAQADSMFTVEATDGPGEDLTYAWDFGDGSVGTGESTTHSFGVIGTYTVTVTVTDQYGASTSTTFDVQVVPAESVAGVGPDSDGDGFSDSLETFVGSDPLSYDSTPFDIAPLGTPEWALVKTLKIKLNFRKANKDRIWLIGEMRLPPGFSFAGKEIVVDISGVQHRMTLDERGRGQDGAVKFRVSGNVYKMTRGFIGNYQATLAEFADLDNLNIFREPRVVRVTMLFDDKAHVRNLVVKYRAFKNRKGIAVKTGRESPVTP